MENEEGEVGAKERIKKSYSIIQSNIDGLIGPLNLAIWYISYGGQIVHEDLVTIKWNEQEEEEQEWSMEGAGREQERAERE